MFNSNKLLFATAIVLTTLTACDKKESSNANTKTSASTTTTTATVTSSTATSSTPTMPIAAPIASSPAATITSPVTSVPSVTSASPTTQSAPSQSMTSDSKSLVTQPVTAGTPEATVKNAMDAMMNGTAKQAASYYQVDMPDFDKVLAEQQAQVKQQLTHLELEPTIYNNDKTKAFIVGKMTTTASPTPQTMKYKLVKVKNDWKLVP